MNRSQKEHITLMTRYFETIYKKLDDYQTQYYTMLKELDSFQKAIVGIPTDLVFLSNEEPLEPRLRNGKESMVPSDTAWCLSDAQGHLEKTEEVLKEIIPILKMHSEAVDRLFEVERSLGECISYLAEVSLLGDEEYEEMKKKSFAWRMLYEGED